MSGFEVAIMYLLIAIVLLAQSAIAIAIGFVLAVPDDRLRFGRKRWRGVYLLALAIALPACLAVFSAVWFAVHVSDAEDARTRVQGVSYEAMQSVD